MTIIQEKNRINLSNKVQVSKWSQTLGCPESVLFYCANKVGVSIPAIEAYWTMNKDWLLKYKGEEELQAS